MLIAGEDVALHEDFQPHEWIRKILSGPSITAIEIPTKASRLEWRKAQGVSNSVGHPFLPEFRGTCDPCFLSHPEGAFENEQ
jgi:hypothetical protein